MRIVNAQTYMLGTAVLGPHNLHPHPVGVLRAPRFVPTFRRSCIMFGRFDSLVRVYYAITPQAYTRTHTHTNSYTRTCKATSLGVIKFCIPRPEGRQRVAPVVPHGLSLSAGKLVMVVGGTVFGHG